MAALSYDINPVEVIRLQGTLRWSNAASGQELQKRILLTGKAEDFCANEVPPPLPVSGVLPDIPEDSLATIFGFLAPAEVAHCGMTCKSWKKAACSNPVWKKLTLALWPTVNPLMPIPDWNAYYRKRLVAVAAAHDSSLISKDSFEFTHIVENCAMLFKCPFTWNSLTPTLHPSIRNCGVCKKQVHLVSDIEDIRMHTKQGNCIAVEFVKTKLVDPPITEPLMGEPVWIPDPVIGLPNDELVNSDNLLADNSHYFEDFTFNGQS